MDEKNDAKKFILQILTYVFTQLLHHGQDVTPDQFLSRVKQVWIESFSFS